MHRVGSFFVIATTLLAAAACGGNNSGNGVDAANGGDGQPGGPDAKPGTPDAAPLPGGVAAIHLTSPDGSFYSAQTSIGSQSFAMIVDTGSSTAAVAGSTCTGCAVNPKYTPGSTATDTHMTASAQYGSGSWNGEIYKDNLGLGNGTPAVQIALASITSQQTFFDGNGNAFQGLLGLGPDGLLTTGTTSYIDAVVKTGITDIMSFELCDSNGGTMWLGGYDQNAVAAAPQYSPMSAQLPYYAVTMSDLKLGTTSVGFTSSSAIVDTGTSLMYVGGTVATNIVTQANKQTTIWTGNFADQGGISCATAKSGVTEAMINSAMPPLNMTFPGSGGSFTISAPASKSYLLPVGGGMYCIGIANGASAGLPNGFVLMGDVGLRGFVTVFDRVQKRIGFASQTGCPASFTADALIDQPAVPLRERGHIPSFKF
jgi:hypothetical protein